MLDSPILKGKLWIAGLTLLCSLAMAQNASAAEADCPAGPDKAVLDAMSSLNFDDKPLAAQYLSFTRTPGTEWDAGLLGQTVSVTVTGKTTAVIPLGLFSYKTRSANLLTSFPQELYKQDRVVLNGCETKTLQVQLPECFYQVDFFYTGNASEYQIQTSYYNKVPIYGVLGGDKSCDAPPPAPEPEPEPGPAPDPPGPNQTPTAYQPPPLSPVTTQPFTGVGSATTPKPVVRACTAVTARSYRVRAKQRNTVTVRVKTTSAAKPKVTLTGAGVRTSKRVGANNTATFRVRPTRGGSIRVTASGCAKVARVRVLPAKRSQRSGTSPTFTG